ncbi:Olfactory Receptor 10J3 [Manis pentadactyla]|nr:Olfactory Receptor 10J3 [Manis pentadactyla]
MTDVEADGVISETLALRKELGSGSVVTVKCEILEPGLQLALVTLKLMLSVQGYAIVKGYGVYRDTVRFESYSDVRREARLIFIIVFWHRLGFRFILRGVADVAADEASVQVISLTCTVTIGQIPGLQCGTGEIHGDELASDTDVGDGHIELQVYFAAWQTLKLMLSVQSDINAEVLSVQG